MKIAPTLHTDAAPPEYREPEKVGHLIFLAGAIKYWWEPGMWDGPLHKEYVAWRNEVRAALIDLGYLTYAPHEAFKGTWVEAAQDVNNAGIVASSLMLILSPRGIPTEGTDEEEEYAREHGVPILHAPPGTGIAALLRLIPAALKGPALRRQLQAVHD